MFNLDKELIVKHSLFMVYLWVILIFLCLHWIF